MVDSTHWQTVFLGDASCYSCTFELTSGSTAEIVANSPQFRRKSSTFVDAIHDLPEKAELAPAQLYSTESGRLFHSGRIVIITVGLPARGKTYGHHPNMNIVQDD